jgi:hypothetical protein
MADDTIIIRNNTAAAAVTNDVVLERGEIAGAYDTGEIYLGDGTDTLANRPKTVTTSGGMTTADLVPVTNGTGGYSWQTPSGGGGGSSGSTSIATFTGVSTAQTLNSFVTDPVQIVNLTGNPVITLAAGPSGQEVSGAIKYVQDSTGGRTWSYAGSVSGPVQVPGAAPNGADWTFLQWDGSGWTQFPATSGPTVVTATALALTGGLGGRFLGVQATGDAPVSSGTLDGDFWLDTLPCFFVWNGSTWGQIVTGTGGGGGGAISFENAPGPYSVPIYVEGTSDWFAANPMYVDVTAEWDINVTNVDNSSAVNTAVQDLGQLGLKGYLPPGFSGSTPTLYPLKLPIVIGNGTSSAFSSWTGWLEGVSVPTYVGATNYNQLPQNLTSGFAWTAASGYSGAMVEILGPVSGWGLRNLLFNAGSLKPLLAVNDVSGRNGIAENLAFYGSKGGITHTTVGASISGVSTNASRNNWRNISIGVVGNGSTTASGILFTNGSLSTGGDSCYEMYDGVWIESTQSGGPTALFGVTFQCCDSIRMHDVNIAAGSHAWTASLLYDYTYAGGAHPADCVIDVIEQGGPLYGATQLGTPSTAAGRNRVEHISLCNGQAPDPTLSTTAQPTGYSQVTNTTWGSPYLSGQLTLNGSGSGSVSRGMIASANANSSGTTSLNPIMRFSLVTPGSGGVGQPYVSSISGSTATITSTNTADNSTYRWELLVP